MWGADLWNLYGTEGLVKRTPTVTRQQRRRARQQVDMVSQKKPQNIFDTFMELNKLASLIQGK